MNWLLLATRPSVWAQRRFRRTRRSDKIALEFDYSDFKTLIAVEIVERKVCCVGLRLSFSLRTFKLSYGTLNFLLCHRSLEEVIRRNRRGQS